jgi:ABC-2 type transport system permease protein
MAELSCFGMLLLYNAIFLAILGVIALFLSRRKPVAFAVLKRNFLGYFANPTGYVFLCLFVLLTSMAAFWPHEFFVNNLASLDQLNKWFIYIMLFFIPAITMSIWAEERRQGTDELLLTLPATDFDIVVGKYFAAVSIFTASLLFSQLATFIVLALLSQGQLDVGLFFTNYLGFWFTGIAMIAIGMVASFLTNNLTVGFILGALFNAPLVFAGRADVISASREASRWISSYGLNQQFENFGRGVISFASVSFFILLAVFGVYLCMILVGRRHWSGGKEGNEMFFHYLFRTLAMLALVLGGSLLLKNKDFFRLDASQGQVSSLSPTTKKMIRNLATKKEGESDDDAKRPIVIDAFISAEVPENLVRTRFSLISNLREMESQARKANVPLTLRINDQIEPKSEQEALAKEQFGIEPRSIQTIDRGVFSDKPVLLAAAFRRGLEKVVVPFFEPGMPVEYELIRAMNTVSRPARKRLGVIRTDANLMGGGGMMMQQNESQPLVDELKKQYDVDDVDPSRPINTTLYAVLLAVQPSSLGPEELTNFTDAVRSGVPTAIFEDPMPQMSNMPGTGEPKQQGGPMAMFGGGGQVPKGDMRELWKVLGISIPGEPSMMTGGINPDIAWQRYNPYPQLESLSRTTNQWVFVSNAANPKNAFNPDHDATKGLKEILLFYPGVVEAEKDGSTNVTPLLSTSEDAGRISINKLGRNVTTQQQIRLLEGPSLGEQTLAVYVTGKDEPAKPKDEGEKSDAESNDSQAATGGKKVRAIYVADADCASPTFFDIQNRDRSMDVIDFQFQNVTFVLNCIDYLADELDYPAVRRHVPEFVRLYQLDQQAAQFRDEASQKLQQYRDAFEQEEKAATDAKNKAEQELRDKVEALQREGAIDQSKQSELIKLLQMTQVREALEERKLEVKLEQLTRERDQKIEVAQREAAQQENRIKNIYKVCAAFLPAIPPLLIGVIVFASRRLREREGIAKSRLK